MVCAGALDIGKWSIMRSDRRQVAMKQKAAISALALLLALPAWAQRGGGHGGFSGGGRGGGRGGGSGGGSGGHVASAPHAAVAAHIAAAHAASVPAATSAPRASNSGFAASHFLPPPDSAPRGTMQHLPVGTLATKQAPAPTPSRVTVAWTTTTARVMTAARASRLTVAAATAATQLPRPSVVLTSAFQVRHPAFFASNFFFFSRRSSLFIFIGDGFFPFFFFDSLGCDPFLVNPFCPFCATGRILKLNRSFVPRAFFFDEFFPRRFFPGFGSGVFLAGAAMPGVAPEQATEEEKPAEAGRFMEEAPARGGELAPSGVEGQAPARPITLLQLKNGWMYGLTDYWIEDGRLHYVTTYGGENSVALEQIDFDETVRLNAERGVEFVLRPKPQSR